MNVEYVSANPTGPLHVGHCRGAVFGDALATLLEATGFAVTREYYINDAGAQVDTLARSVYLRYLEALGETIGEIPSGLYPGDYLVPVGVVLAEQHGKKFVGAAEAEWLAIFRDKAIAMMMDLIREDLAALNIKQPSVSKMERQADMYLSTLRDYVKAIGGELDLIVRLPKRRALRINRLGEVFAAEKAGSGAAKNVHAGLKRAAKRHIGR